MPSIEEADMRGRVWLSSRKSWPTTCHCSLHSSRNSKSRCRKGNKGLMYTCQPCSGAGEKQV